MPKYYYNHASHEEISDVYEKPMKCRVCGEIKPGYGDLADRICLDCNDFVFKDTEYGFFQKDGTFKKEYKTHKDNPPILTKDVINKLSRTPDYTTWQQSHWLFHCSEPMNYLGTWDPGKFLMVAHANNRTPQELFTSMTDAEEMVDWLKDFIAKWPNEWGITYYAFRCGVCGKYRGHWDAD